MPRPSDSRVRVRHRSGVEKLVDRSRLATLGPFWSPVERKRPRRRPAKPEPVAADEVTPTTPPAVEPDTDSHQEG